MRRNFGQLPDGTAVDVITLRNGSVEMDVLTYGCIIRSLRTPDRTTAPADIVLGFTTIDEYVRLSPYFGAVVGRYANRIGKARFTLGERTFQLPANEPPNHLHGGIRGFDKRIWDADVGANDTAVTLTRTSPDGEEGYPGALVVEVVYALTHASDLRVEYRASTDAPTVINLTQHSYFNLRGEGNGDVRQHQLRIDADQYLPVDTQLLPTGELAQVQGTRFDFRRSRPIAGEYDHNFVLRKAGGGISEVARLFEPKSGRVMEVLTTEPGLQVYTGQGLDGSFSGKSGRPYVRQGAVCLETQHYPDSPNHPEFPPVVLLPDARYESRTVFRFRTE